MFATQIFEILIDNQNSWRNIESTFKAKFICCKDASVCPLKLIKKNRSKKVIKAN